MIQGIRHGCYYLKKGREHTIWSLSPTVECKHTARPLSPTANVNTGFRQESSNCDAIRRTTQSLLPQKRMRAYDTTTITHCRMQTRDFFGNLVTVMLRGVQHDRYYLKKGCEHTTWPLSSTVECKHTARSLSPTTNMRAYDMAIISQNVSIWHDHYRPLQNVSIRHSRYHPLQNAYKNPLSLLEHMLDIDLHDMFRKGVSSSALPIIYGLTTYV